MHEPKVQSVTEGGAAAGATALVKEKPSSYVGGVRQRLIEKALRQLSTFIVKISFLLSFVSKFTNLLIGHTSGIYSRNIIIIISPSYFFKRTFGGAI